MGGDDSEAKWQVPHILHTYSSDRISLLRIRFWRERNVNIMAGKFKVAPEIKAEILKKIKDEGAKVSEMSKQYGISDGTIYTWLNQGVSPGSSYAELARLRKHNQQLLLTVGFYAARELAAKKGAQSDNLFTT